MSRYQPKFKLEVLELDDIGVDIGETAQQRMLEGMSYFKPVFAEQCSRHREFGPEFRIDVTRVYPRLIWLAQQNADVGVNYGEFASELEGPVDA